jgi:hypothetical protein
VAARPVSAGLAAADVAANAVAPAVEAAAFSKAAHAATSDEVTAACEPKDAATKVQWRLQAIFLTNLLVLPLLFVSFPASSPANFGSRFAQRRAC